MTNFCINSLCFKNKNSAEVSCVLHAALSFFMHLWMYEDREDELSFHIDKDYQCEGFSFAEFLDRLQSDFHDISQIFARKIVFPCFENEQYIELLTSTRVFFKNVLNPDALMFYYAYLANGQSASGPFVILSFFNQENWNVAQIDFQISKPETAKISKSINNQYYQEEEQLCKAIARKFFPFSIKNSIRFRKSSHPPIKGAIIYEEIATGNLWYRDTFHIGDCAHFEVYDSKKMHLGEATLEGVLKPHTADSSKNGKI